jgi:uncharacterized Zn-binding protein involved in type VI secretion
MPPGARVGDATAHGTPLSGAGSSTVLIEGRPAWRAGTDFHACPLIQGAAPHVGGTVAGGSATVLIEGTPAARVGDTIVENGPPNTIVTGAPTVLIGGGAAPAEPEWASSLYERLSSYTDDYNARVGSVDLGPVAGQLASESVNLFVDTEDGTASFSFRTDATNRIETFERGDRDDATLRMETDRATVDRIADAESPVAAFRQAVADGDIRIHGLGPVNAVKWTILNGVKGFLLAL